jgi:hypothetical protein
MWLNPAIKSAQNDKIPHFAEHQVNPAVPVIEFAVLILYIYFELCKAAGSF